MSVSGWRWSGLGVAGLVTAVAVTGSLVSGAGGGSETVFVPVTPCRLIDTRPNVPGQTPTNVGPRSTPIPDSAPVTFTAWGSDDGNSTCEIPSSATAISTNTTIVNPTNNSFLKLYPADAALPDTSNLNYVAGQAPTPNAVTTPLSPTGQFNVYNRFGTVDVIVDVVGYYQPSTSIGDKGDTGLQGDTGLKGDTGDAGPAGPVNRISDDQIALLQWYQDPGAAATFDTLRGPFGVAFDGTSIWIANLDSDMVSKMNPVTGSKVDYETLIDPWAVAFDGTSIWITNQGSNMVSKMNPATGDRVDYETLLGPSGVAFDGTSIWIANADSDMVSKMNPATGDRVDYDGFDQPYGVAFDGTSIWITNAGSTGVSKMNPVDGTKVDYGTLITPAGVAFDGTSIWITNLGSSKVSKMNPVDGTRVDYDTLQGPWGVAFDGTNIWITHQQNKVSKVNPVDGTRVDYDTTSQSFGVAFDGTNIWITQYESDKVSKMNPGS